MDNNIFIERIENYVENNIKDGIWKDVLELEKITNIDIRDILTNINKVKNIKQNSKGDYTTQYLYDKYTKFYSKFLDGYLGYYR